MKVRAHAKINLFLEVTGKRPNGYHDIDTVMQELALADVLTLDLNDSDSLTLTTDVDWMDCGEDNLVTKAWTLLKGHYSGPAGCRIHIEKKIPAAAGLAGGTADGAQTLLALNQLWGLGYSVQDLADLALPLGADFPYCLHGGTMRAQGIGEVLTPLQSLAGRKVLLVNPGLGVSTQEVYRAIDLAKYEAEDCGPLVQEINRGQTGWEEKLFNRMEPVTDVLCPQVAQIRARLQALGAQKALMSGSGPTVFGLFDQDRTLEAAYQALKGDYPLVIATEMI